MINLSDGRRWPRKLLKEPLLHFFLIGAAMFLIYQWQRPSAQVADNEIVVTSSAVAQLLAGFERTWQRPPTRQDLDGLIENYLRDEIYYREARALGLDQADIIVRRRLRQKLEYVLEDVASQTEPTDAELQEFMAGSPERFAYEPRFSFRQIYLNPEQRGEQLDSDLIKLLTRLHANPHTADMSIAGDPSLLPPEVSSWNRSQVVSTFGERFVKSLEGLESGRWQGPVESSLGTHLVDLQEHQRGRLPKLAEVRESVRNEWLTKKRSEAADASYRNLRQRYKVDVDLTGLPRELLAHYGSLP